MIDKEIEIIQHGCYQIATRPGRNGSGGFVSWGKIGEIMSDGPLLKPGEVWFEFGSTRDEAVLSLLDSLGIAVRN